MRSRQLASALLAASLAPLVVGSLTVQPAVAGPRAGRTPSTAPLTTVGAVGYDTYGLTGLASGVRTAGDVGNAGGLVTLDSGSAYVAAHLDSAPSAGVVADPYEPGTLARTVAGQVNAGAGSEVVTVPDAAATYPGNNHATLVTVPAQTAGPLTLAGGSATALAAPNRAEGSATGSTASVTGALQAEGSVSAIQLMVNRSTGLGSSVATARISRLVAGGVLELRNVVARAAVTTHGDAHVATAELTVGGAQVGGQEVAIDATGVHAVGIPLVPGTTIADATKTVDGVLQTAGVAAHVAQTVRRATRRSGEADTGGVVVTIRSPNLPGGVAANALTVLIGEVALTEVDTPLLPALTTPLPAAATAPAGGGGPDVGLTTTIPGTPAVPALPGAAPALTAPRAAPLARPARFVLAGRQISVAAALAAFAAWQFLSLGTATLYALVERRRRLGLS
ncbi:MAG: hypothetical protein NVSMB55_27910 [Mycobacteriales bacterium]